MDAPAGRRGGPPGEALSSEEPVPIIQRLAFAPSPSERVGASTVAPFVLVTPSVLLAPVVTVVPFVIVALAVLTSCASRDPEAWGRATAAEEIKTLETRPWGDPEHIVATVNGRPITRGDFYVRVLNRFGTAKLLAGILKEELFLQEAKRRGIVASAAEVSAKVDEIIAEMARDAGGETELERIYEREGIALADLRRDLHREVSTQLVIGKVTMSFREIDDDALRKYYQGTYAKTRHRTRHIAYSFVPVPGQSEGEANRRKLEAFNKAVRTADRLRKGADFVTIARAESEDEVTASRGGDLGFIDESSPMDPTLKKAIRELPAGGVSEPVENPAGGYHIFQVTEIAPSQSYVDCLSTMQKELLEKEPTLEEIEGVLAKLRERSDVRVFELGDVPRVPGGGAAVPPSDPPVGSRGAPVGR